MKIVRFSASLVMMFWFLTSLSGDKGMKDLKIGSDAPMAEVKMKNVDNSELSLLDVKKNNGLVVVFSCNTCPFVVGSENFSGWEKDYNALAKMAEEQGFGFVLVNSNEAKRTGDDSFDEMKIRARKMEYSMPYLVDENAALANAFGAKTTPHVFLFNEKMKLSYVGSIDNAWEENRTKDIPYLINAMTESQKGKVSENETKPVGCSIKRMAK